MLQLVAVDGATVQAVTATEFPFTIGRSRSAHFRLDSPGVWDNHAAITLKGGRFHISPEGESLLLINDERSNGGLLRMGDQLSLGAARITVMLAPAARRGLKAREMPVWLAVGAVTLAQLLLINALR